MTQLVLPEEGSHWYYADGTPCHTVPMTTRDGERQTNVRDARRMALLPSVTVGLTVLHKPQLQAYLINQHLMSALTLPEIPGESTDDRARRVMLDARVHGEQAATFGTRVHEWIEWTLGQRLGVAVTEPILNIGDMPIIAGIQEWLSREPIEPEVLERNLASTRLGYGGRLDCIGTWRGKRYLIDWKTQEGRLRGRGQERKLAFNHYPENAMQGVAYSKLWQEVTGEPELLPNLILYIDRVNPGHIEPVVYDNETHPWRWPAFVSCLFLYRTLYLTGQVQVAEEE